MSAIWSKFNILSSILFANILISIVLIYSTNNTFGYRRSCVVTFETLEFFRFLRGANGGFPTEIAKKISLKTFQPRNNKSQIMKKTRFLLKKNSNRNMKKIYHISCLPFYSLHFTFTFYILHFYILHLTSYILHLTSYILHLTSYILHLTSYILHLTSFTSLSQLW